VSDALPAAFRFAWESGDTARMSDLLDPDAVLLCDTGGVVDGPLDPINGATAIAEWILARFTPGLHRLVSTVANSQPALRIECDGDLVGTLVMRPDEHRLTMLWLTLNPEKLRSGENS